MSIRWDPLVVAALARELDARLGRARVRSLLLDGDSRRVHLFLREGTLVLEMHPTAGWISLLEPHEPLPGARPLAAKIRGVRALPDESAMVLDLQRVRGKDEGVQLAVEWTGNRWNAAVVGHRSRVIRHVLVPRDERTRSLTVGAEYALPPSTGRVGVEGDLSLEEWTRILEEAGNDPQARRRALLSRVAWTSSLNAERFLEADGWTAWREALDPETWAPHEVETPRSLQPYPIPLPPHPSRESESMMDAIARARAEAETDAEAEPLAALLLPAGLLERAQDRLARVEGRLRGLRRELERARDPAPVRALGDLILARYGEIQEGSEHAELRGFDGEAVEVELDPSLPPHENAKRYYDEAARIERARDELPRRIRRAERDAEKWRDAVDRLQKGEGDLEEISRRLGPERPRRQKGRKRPESGALPYRTFRSSGGLEIRVGRGARSNDDLTFRHSAPDDVWMHVRQAPGAHVILRWTDEGSPPRRDLLEAGVLAALHSEARHAGSVPVDWTRRKYVRKPRKAPPGAVLPDRVQTLFVEPDPRLAERLATESGKG